MCLWYSHIRESKFGWQMKALILYSTKYRMKRMHISKRKVVFDTFWMKSTSLVQIWYSHRLWGCRLWRTNVAQDWIPIPVHFLLNTNRLCWDDCLGWLLQQLCIVTASQGYTCFGAKGTRRTWQHCVWSGAHKSWPGKKSCNRHRHRHGHLILC